jgi:integrase/recombinase XerD
LEGKNNFLNLSVPLNPVCHMLPTVILKPFHYRGQECIGLDLLSDNTLEKEVRKIKGIRWWGGKNYWYLPLSKENYLKIKAFLTDKATLDTSPLRQYLEQRKGASPLIQKEKVSKARHSCLLTFLFRKKTWRLFRSTKSCSS